MSLIVIVEFTPEMKTQKDTKMQKNFSKIIQDGMWGLAVGDAAGVPYEFQARGCVDKEHFTMIGYGTHMQPIGTWSDDTSMTLCLMDSLSTSLKKQTIDYKDIMYKFNSWITTGQYSAHGAAFDIGNTILNALLRFQTGANALECGGSSERENGNGGIMRAFPLAFIEVRHIGAISKKEIIHNVTKLTHAHPISIIGSGIYCSILKTLIEKPAHENLMSSLKNEIYKKYQEYLNDNEYKNYVLNYSRLIDIESFVRLPEKEISSKGYVVDTLECALWCFLNTNSYKECISLAVSLGGDTDTIGSIAGTMAGLHYGKEGIPREWLFKLKSKSLIESISAKYSKIITNL